MGFHRLLGNDQLKQNLKTALASGHISHFYLISGPAGSGRHTLARLLAAAILCQEQQKPCMCCSTCRKVMANTHPDFITVNDPISNVGNAANGLENRIATKERISANMGNGAWEGQ